MSREEKKQEIRRALSTFVVDMSYDEIAALSDWQLFSLVEGVEEKNS